MSGQTQKRGDSDPKKNLLLASLEREDYEALMRGAKVIPLKFRKRLYRQEDPVDFVYFPITCMVSLLVTTSSQPSMEMATIGREGVVGASELIQRQGAMGLSIIQLPGTAARIDRDAFQKVTSSRPRLQDLMHRHLFALMRQVLFGAACNRMHSMEERCARWLLMTHDRAGQDAFPLTQEFLSHMLGVRRATVNVATGGLKKAGFIQYVRGRVTLIDRPGLESASCGCYQATIRAYNSILPGAQQQSI
jgi:CRP-like cAMP-binding protein